MKLRYQPLLFSLLFFVGFMMAIPVSQAFMSDSHLSHANQTNTQTNAPEPKTIIPFNKPVTGDLPSLLNRLVNILFTLIASVSIIFIIIGGFRLAFSQGNSEAVTAGKKTITWAIIGLVVALLAYAIVRIVVNILY